MGRLIAGFVIFVAILFVINLTYPGRIILRYLLILFIVSLLLLSSTQIAYLLNAIGDPTITQAAQGAPTSTQGGVITPL